MSVCEGDARVLTRRRERELWQCRGCRFAWVPQGVMRTADGRSIFEGGRFVADEQADHCRDPSTIDAARDKLAWAARESRGTGRLLDVDGNFGCLAREAAARFEALGFERAPRRSRGDAAPGLASGGRLGRQPAPQVRRPIRRDRDVRRNRAPAIPGGRAGTLPRVAPDGPLFLTTPDAGPMGRHRYYIDLTEHISLFVVHRAPRGPVRHLAGDRSGQRRAGDGERDYVVLENTRASPRTWIVANTLPLSPVEARLRAAHSLLPGGRRFDPATLATGRTSAPGLALAIALPARRRRPARHGMVQKRA